MSKKKILIQLDPDRYPSTFDSVVAIDSGADHLLTYGDVESTEVRDLVHGAIFTRGIKDLQNTAIFIGGSDIHQGEQLLSDVCRTFFGPMRVSVMMDANGCNTTAAAAVLCAMKHRELQGAKAVVLAGTGPVGQRIARLLAAAGAEVRLASRTASKAQTAAETVAKQSGSSQVTGVATKNGEETKAAIAGASLIFAAGAAGAELASATVLETAEKGAIAIDLNATPPLGLAGVDVMDAGKERGNLITYGAIGVGGLKMKIHKAAIAQLFTKNDLVIDIDQVFEIGKAIS
jgi:methylenetetrahydrofolate/methylenetetrahydromethanopterin dehydrogenase (NADP+)